jgi:hypothetical protein
LPLGREKRKRKKEKKGSAHSTRGFFWEKWPKLPDFEGKKINGIAKFRQCYVSRILKLFYFPFFWMVIRPSQDFNSFFSFQFHGFESLVIFFHFLAIWVKSTLKKKTLGMDGLER